MKRKTFAQGLFSAIGALMCATSVALSAYANHGLEAQAQDRMLLAAYFAFAHGLSLIVLARVSHSKSDLGACSLMLAGLLMFSGSLISSVIWQTATTLAPAGGIALILSWCWSAVNLMRLKDD